MSANLDKLRAMLADKTFHHATYRGGGSLWEGLWVYRKSATGFRGFEVALSFLKNDPDLVTADSLLAFAGTSLGAYGEG